MIIIKNTQGKNYKQPMLISYDLGPLLNKEKKLIVASIFINVSRIKKVKILIKLCKFKFNFEPLSKK